MRAERGSTLVVSIDRETLESQDGFAGRGNNLKYRMESGFGKVAMEREVGVERAGESDKGSIRESNKQITTEG